MVMGRGLMVVGGGGDGPMVGDCDPMGIGRGSDGRGFVSVGCGSSIYWSGSLLIY